MTNFVPPNNMPMRGKSKEVLFLGQYGEKHDNGPSNIARNVNLDKDNPAIIEEMMETHRLIANPFNRNEPSFRQTTSRLVMNAYPRKIFRHRPDGSETYFIVLSKPLQMSNNTLVRINTSSSEDETNRRGKWHKISGRPSSVSHARGVRERNGFVRVSCIDDLVVLHDQDIVKVVTEGSESIDDQVLMNVNGHLVMAPAISFFMSGLEPKMPDAETVEAGMAAALAEQDFEPEEVIQQER